MIKHVREHIKLPLTHICNLSFSTGVFPCELKIANVVSIFKANDEMIFSNDRSVSVLPVLSKLIERLMYNRLIHYMNENKLLYKYQFGFQTDKSTHMALIVSLDKISEALERGECVIGIFLDCLKVFDTVYHSILLKKCINMVHRAWLYVGLRIIYTIENNMLIMIPTNQIMSSWSVVSPKAPFVGHCSFYCILIIHLQCQRPASQFYLQIIPTCL